MASGKKSHSMQREFVPDSRSND